LSDILNIFAKAGLSKKAAGYESLQTRFLRRNQHSLNTLLFTRQKEQKQIKFSTTK
jgi:hypothetical protein